MALNAKKIELSILSPLHVVYKNEVDQVIIPTKDGEITLLPNHTPLVSALADGEMLVQQADGEKISFFIYGGVLEVRPDSTVVVLTDESELSSSISTEQAQAAYDRAKQVAEEAKSRGDTDYSLLEAQMKKELLRLHIGKKKRR
ncbi:MAG: F-type H+-transporting ATPase subunit epsilon [Planctomycetota bacterium]|jgi:F-type H+-transporting ATPase subunit epsilon